jgi:hypothetical protein
LNQADFNPKYPIDFEFYKNEATLRIMAKLYHLAGEDYYEANALQIWKEVDKRLNEEELKVVGKYITPYITHFL